MKNLLRSGVAALVLGAVGPTATLAVLVDRNVVLDKGGISRRVSVRDVRLEGPDIVIDLVNHTDRSVTDVRLLVADSFLWKDEMHPGDDDPSRATTLLVPGPIQPNERLTVRAELPPLPVRSDGKFETRVEIVGIVEERPPGAEQILR